MMSLKMGSVSFNQQNNHGIMVDQNQDFVCIDSSSEDSSNFSSSADDELLGEEDGEERNSSFSSSDPTLPNSSGSSSYELTITTGALQNMSSLLQELPFKRGLSKHYNGKSQSFTSLSNVCCLEDLAKPENPCRKKLKSCKSYGVFLEDFKSDHHQSPLSKKANRRGSYSSYRARRNASFLGNNNRPPVPPHRSTSTTSFTNQTPLFA